MVNFSLTTFNIAIGHNDIFQVSIVMVMLVMRIWANIGVITKVIFANAS